MLMERTDPNLVGLCLDTGHYRFGGGDPVEAYTRHADRVWHVHFKGLPSRYRCPFPSEMAWDYFESVGKRRFL